MFMDPSDRQNNSRDYAQLLNICNNLQINKAMLVGNLVSALNWSFTAIFYRLANTQNHEPVSVSPYTKKLAKVHDIRAYTTPLAFAETMLVGD